MFTVVSACSLFILLVRCSFYPFTVLPACSLFFLAVLCACSLLFVNVHCSLCMFTILCACSMFFLCVHCSSCVFAVLPACSLFFLCVHCFSCVFTVLHVCLLLFLRVYCSSCVFTVLPAYLLFLDVHSSFYLFTVLSACSMIFLPVQSFFCLFNYLSACSLFFLRVQNAGPRWVVHNLAALYWRALGNLWNSVECLRGVLAHEALLGGSSTEDRYLLPPSQIPVMTSISTSRMTYLAEKTGYHQDAKGELLITASNDEHLLFVDVAYCAPLFPLPSALRVWRSRCSGTWRIVSPSSLVTQGVDPLFWDVPYSGPLLHPLRVRTPCFGIWRCITLSFSQ